MSIIDVAYPHESRCPARIRPWYNETKFNNLKHCFAFYVSFALVIPNCLMFLGGNLHHF